LSEETSDLQTDQESRTSKRKTVPRQISSNDEEESDEIHVRPPKLKTKFQNSIQPQEKTPIFRNGKS
jgi:hypothetical protein